MNHLLQKIVLCLFVWLLACLFVCLLVCSCLCSFACECLVVYCASLIILNFMGPLPIPVARQLLNLSSSLPFTWLGLGRLIDAGLQDHIGRLCSAAKGKVVVVEPGLDLGNNGLTKQCFSSSRCNRAIRKE